MAVAAPLTLATLSTLIEQCPDWEEVLHWPLFVSEITEPGDTLWSVTVDREHQRVQLSAGIP